MSYIVLDCETTNGFDDPLIYDIGWSILDDNFKLIKTKSFVVADIFIEEPELMAQAFFASKIPQYFNEIAENKRELRRYETIRNILYKDCKNYNVKAVVAHNAKFDYKACQTTQRWLTCSKYRWFFPYGVEIWDTLAMSRQIFAKDEDYLKFCRDNDYCIGKNSKRPRLTAEILYRYITKNNDFIESHTGLEDTLIEKEIFKICMEKNPNCKKSPWREI